MIVDYHSIIYTLHVYTWLMVSFLIVIIAAIGFFYQKKFHIKIRYYLFFIAAILVMCELCHIVFGDCEWIEPIKTVGIVIAAILSIRLYRTMTGAA
jgi:xanthine/uracil permease